MSILKKKFFWGGFIACFSVCIVFFLLFLKNSDPDKTESQRKFYKPSSKSRKIQEDFFNTDPFANSLTNKKSKPIKIGITKLESTPVSIGVQKSKKVTKEEPRAISPDKPIVSKKVISKIEINIKKPAPTPVSIDTPKPKEIVKEKIKATPMSSNNDQSAKPANKNESNEDHSLKIVERLRFISFFKKNKKYKIKLIKILVWSKNKVGWRVGVKFVEDDRRWKEKFLKLNEIFEFKNDKYKLVDIKNSSIKQNQRKRNTSSMNVDFFSNSPRRNKQTITILNLSSGEKRICSLNNCIRFSDIYAILVDKKTKEIYRVRNNRILKIGDQKTKRIYNVLFHNNFKNQPYCVELVSLNGEKHKLALDPPKDSKTEIKENLRFNKNPMRTARINERSKKKRFGRNF